jgi:tRNA threonylcarbamoyladenosine biosynthesis protein TsaB
MGRILCIETATQVCGVALGTGGVMAAQREICTENAHSGSLTLLIEEVISAAGMSIAELDAVAVSKGPGSYTGLRIGVSAAKGLCYALSIPLIGVHTLQAMAYGMRHAAGGDRLPDDSLFCPMIDARRMEVYTALYDMQNKEVLPPCAEIITRDSLSAYFAEHPVYVAGNGAEKCREVLGVHSGLCFMDIQLPSAAYLLPLAEKKFAEGSFENTAYFEPFYLKDFVAGEPKVKGLH